MTINLGIDLYAEATIEVTPHHDASSKSEIVLESEDQGHEISMEWSALESIEVPPQLELHAKILRHFVRKRNPSGPVFLKLSTRAMSPAGAGLGGSSTLSIAILGALSTWIADKGAASEAATIADPLKDGESLIEIARDIETTVIQVPAGVQDYYGAMFGGLQSLKWGVGKHQREWLPENILSELESRMMLFYSGQSRNSGINNWALYKSFIDNSINVREKFVSINRATQRLEAALRLGDWRQVGEAISEEWATRRTLAPGITTPEMDRAFAKAKEIEPSVSGKVCGAGGGGCFFVYLEGDPHSPETQKTRTQIEQAFVSQGIRPLPFKASPRGLYVQVKRA